MLAAALALGHWREPLVAAAALPMLTMLLFRRRPAPSAGPDAPFVRGCLLYAVLAVGLAGWDLLVQTRLPELLSPLAATPWKAAKPSKAGSWPKGATSIPGPARPGPA